MSAECLRRSAEAGNSRARYRLGKLYLQGEDVPKDVSTAVRWLTAAAEQGDQFAQYALGKLYLLGRELPADRDKALRWFTLSAAQGNEYAGFFLGHMEGFRRAALISCAARLLRHLGGVFRAQGQRSITHGVQLADSKLRQRIREKKIALGHKYDDRAPELDMSQ